MQTCTKKIASLRQSVFYPFFLIYKTLLCLSILLYISLTFTQVNKLIALTLQFILLLVMITDIVIRSFSSTFNSQNIMFMGATGNAWDVCLGTLFGFELSWKLAQLQDKDLFFMGAIDLLLLTMIQSRSLIVLGKHFCTKKDIKQKQLLTIDFNHNETNESNKKVQKTNLNNSQIKYEEFHDEINESKQQQNQQKNKNFIHNFEMSINQNNIQKYTKFQQEFNQAL